MKKVHSSTLITLWINRAVALLMAVLLFVMPAQFHEFILYGQILMTVSFYCCSVVIGVALWLMDALLRSILRNEIFVRANVIRISRIRLCCGIVALICLPAAWAFPALVFLSVIMGFLCLVVSVVANVMDAAVSLQEENDLTI